MPGEANFLLIIPDPLLPTQRPHNDGLDAERALYAAVLAEAIDCLAGNALAGGFGRAKLRVNEQRRAREWFASGRDIQSTDFLAICRLLDLNAAEVRARLSDGTWTGAWRVARANNHGDTRASKRIGARYQRRVGVADLTARSTA